jgi:hypothetical protein
MDDDIEPADGTLNAARAAVLEFFSHRAGEEGVAIRPQGAERDMNLAWRVYWERSDGREFSITWSDPERPWLDAFVKRTGLDDELELLYVTSAVGCGFEPALWSLYRGWMHDGMDAEAAISLAATLGQGSV